MITLPLQEPSGPDKRDETPSPEAYQDHVGRNGRAHNSAAAELASKNQASDDAASNDPDTDESAQNDALQNHIVANGPPSQDQPNHDEAPATGLALQGAVSGSALAHRDSLTSTALAGDSSANGVDGSIAVRAPVTVAPSPSLPPAAIPQPSAPQLAPLQFVTSYDALRQRLAAHPLRRRSLFLTSTGPREGTTTTALNLARGFAREAKTLLVELRFTQPRLRQQLGQALTGPGLEEGLRGVAELQECVLQDAQSALSTLTIKVPLSAEEASHQSGPLNDLLQWAEERFDWMVLDCPPVTSPEWTLWFDLNADPVLLIVRSGVTHERAVRKAGRRLKDRLTGAVLLQP